jgi:2,4-dienoyl-CoA reductase-like NADH-dependent reductase (Old Yellow Enzyme family)
MMTREGDVDPLFQSTSLGPLVLKNRIVRSATNEHLSEPDGQVTRVWADTLIELAKNEVGLVISGHFCVDASQRANEGQPVLDDATDIELLHYAVDGVHRYGGKILFQLSHSGIKALESVNGVPPKHPEDFTMQELDQLVGRFVTAALRCQGCGADGVQIHTAHGYLLSNFLNPAENRRTDEYGGRLENRFRLVARILSAVRTACGEKFALIVKTDCNGCEDFSALLRLYEKYGVDGIEVSGIDFNQRVGQKTPFYAQNLLQSCKCTSIPVFQTGGVFSRQVAEELLQQKFPLVSFSRALICEPDFISKLKSGTQNESKCLACNGCFSVYRRRFVRCTQHRSPIPQLQKVFDRGS